MIGIEYKDTKTGTWKEATWRTWKTKRGALNYLKNWWNTTPDGIHVRLTGEEERAKVQRTPTLDPKGWVHVGDIFHHSWGYDMRINDFYEVVAVSTSGKTCTVRQIETLLDGDEMAPGGCYAKPKLTGDDRFIDDPIKGKRITLTQGANGSSCSISMGAGMGSAYLMEPEDYVRGFHEDHCD